jgi:hypothetical protein
MWSANTTNKFFILLNLTTCIGPYGPSSGDNYRNDIQYVLFRRFSFYCNPSIIFMTLRLIYCFLIYLIYCRDYCRKSFLCPPVNFRDVVLSQAQCQMYDKQEGTCKI